MTKYGNTVLFNGINFDVYQNPQMVARAISKINLFELDPSSTLEEWVGAVDATALHQWHRASYILGLGHRDLAATMHTINEILQQALKLLTLIVRFVRNVLVRFV